MSEIVIEKLSKKIGESLILDDISMEFQSGKIYGIRGKNGCGKTMLLRCIAGLIKPTNGKIFVDNVELNNDNPFPGSIGLLLENPCFLPDYSGFENLRILQSIEKKYNETEISAALKRVGLDEGKKVYKKYSLGMKQKLGIAYAILGEPDIILLDEPINAIDESSVSLIKQTLFELKNKGKTIIVVCHDKSELEILSDEIFVMAGGRIKKE